MKSFGRISTLNKIYDITLEMIKEHNIKGLLVDMDNTLLPWNEIVFREETKQWLKLMKDNAIKICVITNSGYKRTNKVMSGNDLPYIYSAGKPLPFSFWRAGRKIKVKRKHIAVIGDQLFSDMLGSKIAGYRSFLVQPFSNIEHKLTRQMRKIERVFFKRNVK